LKFDFISIITRPVAKLWYWHLQDALNYLSHSPCCACLREKFPKSIKQRHSPNCKTQHRLKYRLHKVTLKGEKPDKLRFQT